MRARQIIPTALCGALVAVLGATPILLLAGVPPLPHAFLLVTIIGAAAGLAGAIVACTAWPRSKTPGPQAEEPTDAERTFRTMAASIPCAVFRCSLDEHWTMHIIGRQIEEITGYPASGFLHNAVRSYASIIHPDDLVSVKEDVFTAAAANQPWTLEYRIRHADDTYRFVFERGRTVRDHAGEVKYLDGFILDNAARHRAEQALRDEKLFADTALNSLPGLFYVFDSEGRFLRWNNNLATVSGYTDKEIAGMAALDFFADEGRETAREAVREVFVSGEHSMENDLFTKSGKKIPHFFTGVRTNLGNGDYLIGMAVNIADRQRAEQALRDSEQQFRELVEHAPEAIVILDCGVGKFAIANRNAEVLFGMTREQLLEKNPAELSPPFQPDGRPSEEASRAYVQEALDGGTPSFEWTHANAQGTEILCEVWLLRLPGERPLVRGSVMDITERRNLENQLRQAQKMEAVGQLAGGVAHDFNNLLQVINGFTDLALEDLPEDSPARPSLEEVADAGRRAASVVGQLLAFSRRQVMRPVDLDLNDVVGEAMNMLARVIGEYIQLDFTPGHRLGAVRADRGMIEQVLVNLCVNARDAMPGGGRLIIRTQNALVDEEFCEANPWARTGRFVLLSVSDTGCGMNSEVAERIFEPFFSTKGEGRGTGLGLSTVYGIVRQHEGVVGVQSELGAGSTFNVYLPLAVGEAVDPVQTANTKPIGGNEVILLAEDESMVRDFASRTLQRAGYTVLTANDGEEAVSVFRQHIDDVDLLLLDVVMPRLSGRHALDLIRDLRPAVPALFASGYSEKALHTNFVLDDDVLLLQKPFTRDDLLRAVRQVLDAPAR